jgi:hypothetical protein
MMSTTRTEPLLLEGPSQNNFTSSVGQQFEAGDSLCESTQQEIRNDMTSIEQTATDSADLRPSTSEQPSESAPTTSDVMSRPIRIPGTFPPEWLP